MENQEKETVEQQNQVKDESPNTESVVSPKKQSRLYGIKVVVLVAFAAFARRPLGL
jgi:hypothetical protein